MKYKKLGDICSLITDYVANGSFASLKENVEYIEDGYAVIIRLKDYRNDFKESFEYVSKSSYEFLKKTKLFGGEIIISNVGANVGTVFKAPKFDHKMTLGPNTIMIKTSYIDDYYYYLFKSNFGQNLLKSIVSGSAQPKFNKTDFKHLEVPVPTIEEQKAIVNRLSIIDDKININKEINDKLFELSKVFFDNSFTLDSPNTTLLSNYFLPKRGHSLLKKNAIHGNVPVVAGGLKPSTYHNTSNTEAPVITISASGANAGFVQIWGQKVWSSDSSYIDSSVVSNIYFWYLLLKSNQKRIFDSQSGSVQPHVYPQQIGNLFIPCLNEKKVSQFNNLVAPIFHKIFENKSENINLKTLRDELLNNYFDKFY